MRGNVIIDHFELFRRRIFYTPTLTVDYHFRVLADLDVNRKRLQEIVLLYDTVWLFLVLFKEFSYL